MLFIASDFLPYLNEILKHVKTIKHVVTMSNQITCTGSGEVPEIEVPPEVNLYEYEDLLENIGEPECEWPNLDERVIAGFHFTSGTTGRPKPVYHTHRDLMLGTLQSLAAGGESPYNMTSRDIPITLTPYFHILGWLAPFQYFCAGMKYIFQEKYEFDHIAKLITEYLPEAKRLNSRIFAAGVPTMLFAIVEELKKLGVTDLENHLLVAYGGSALPLSLYEELKEMGIAVTTGYGPTETGTTTITRAIFTPRMWMKMGWNPEKMTDHYVKNNTIGTLMPFAHGKVVDEDGEELPHDGKSTGKFLFRSPTITKEYYKDLEKTKAAWKSGYLDVNDIVTIDEYGSVNFVDRTKDVIKSGGEWVPSSRLEGFISRHPAVAEVATIGVFHPKWNERPIAIVSLNEGETAREEDIKNHLMKFVEKGRMPKWWIPDKVIFKDQLPKTATAKIDKAKLKEEYKDLQLED